MNLISMIERWRCQCGAHIRVRAEADRDKPDATQSAACPECGNQRAVYGKTIMSIEVTRDTERP